MEATTGGADVGPVVRAGRRADARAAAALHAAHMAGGFLPRLGPRFLERLYARMVASPHAFVLMVDAPGTAAGAPPGFLAGATDVRRLYRDFLWRDGAVAALTAAPRLLRGAPRVLETLRYGTGRTGTGPAPPGTGLDPVRAGTEAAPSPSEVHGPGARGAPVAADDTGAGTAELLAVAVDPAWRRRGVAGALVDGFLAHLVSLGATHARVVVGAGNRAAIALYRSRGFEPVSQVQVHRGVPSLVLGRPVGR